MRKKSSVTDGFYLAVFKGWIDAVIFQKSHTITKTRPGTYRLPQSEMQGLCVFSVNHRLCAQAASREISVSGLNFLPSFSSAPGQEGAR